MLFLFFLRKNATIFFAANVLHYLLKVIRRYLALNDRSNEMKPPLEVEENVVGIMKSLVDLRDDEDMGRVNVKIWVRLQFPKKYF